MTEFLLFVFAFEGLAIVIWSSLKRERMIQFPFLAAGVFFGWVFPQLVGLTNNPYLPRGGLDKTVAMAILCLGAAWAGYVLNRRPAKLFWWRFDRRRLLWASLLLSLAGAFFFYQISLLAPEAGTQWTGIITIYVFFSKLLTIGMVIAVMLHLSKPSWPTLLVISFDLLFYLDRILIKGRRAAMVELGLMMLMALWFHRRWAPPRSAVIAALLVGALVINSIGQYRAIMLGEDGATWSGGSLSDLLEIDYVGNLMRMAQGESQNHELMNAVMNIEATDQLLRFDFGLSHWNGLVHRYVPGQWVGYDVKEALMLYFGDPAYEEFRHVPHPGSTHTGLSDAFRSFWYFGAGAFFVIGLVMSRWYTAAMMGNVVAQMVLILSVTASLHAITHSTHSFSVIFVQLAVFLLPALLWARIKPKQIAARFQPRAALRSNNHQRGLLADKPSIGGPGVSHN